MRHILLGGMLAAIAVSGCSQATDTPDAKDPVTATHDATTEAGADAFAAFVNETFTLADASEANLEAVVSALPAYASMRWDSKSFDPASGATVFEGLSIGIGSDPEFGMTFESASLWGLETDLITARLQGQRLAETGPLFTRLEGTNVSYYGVAQAFNVLFDSILSGIAEDLPEGVELSFDKLESNTERVIVSGVSLRPWELALLPPERVTDLDDEIPGEVVDFIHLGQQLIAVSRAVAIDKSVSIGTQMSLEMRQPGADYSAAYDVGFVGAENIQGMDVDTYVARDVRSTQTNDYTHTPMPGEVISLTGFPAGFSMAQSERYGSSTVTGLRLDKVMGFLARSELPGMDERDLLSFGRWEVRDYEAELNDKEILKAEHAYFNGDSFEWLIPSDISFGMHGATLNTGELTGFFQILFETFISEAAPDTVSEEEQAQMNLVREGVQKAIDLLPEHGLDTLPFDAEFSAKWDADGGPTDFSAAFDADGFGKSAFELGINLPDYTALQAAFEAEDKEVAFEDAVQDTFAFLGARFYEEDKGGYDKLFGFAHALGKEYPDQGWGAMLGNMEPAQLRTYLGTMVRMGKSAAGQDFPPAADWIEAYASYLESGGSFEFRSNPPQPINKALMDSYDDVDPEPEEIVEIFGLTVSHTK